MSPFEYIVVLISIIIGMGITQLLSGLASIVLRWNTIRNYWPHSLLIVLIFVLHIQDWWATWELQSIKHWYLPMFLFIIFYPVNLYVLARILFPLRWGKLTDLKHFYYENFRKIYLFMVFLPLHAIVNNYFIGRHPLSSQYLQAILAIVLILFVILNRREEWLHKVLAIAFLAICIITFIVEWNSLLIINP
jgi:hypothetical protein